MEGGGLSLRIFGLILLHIVVASTFLKGFLLTRIELPDVSRCNHAICTGHKPYTKAVVLIVDALRYDFVCEKSANASYYRGKLPKTLNYVAAAGPAAVATRFVADTPTITMSRLKALLTGGLPTFLDVGQSFSASALTEDNLLQQLLVQGKRLVVMGDDTWMQLAKDAFTEAYPYPSFNVHDLHTVDDGVWQNLVPVLARPASWDVLIAHYLGVDHAGHTYGTNSKQMEDKLEQMDDQVSTVIESLVSQSGPGGAYENTLLMILSDHGQTQGGDHGGGTHDETDSVLIAFNLRDMSSQRITGQQAADDISNTVGNKSVEGRNHSDSSSEDSVADGLLDHLMAAGGYLDTRGPADLQQQYPQLSVGPWCCNSSMSQIDLTPLLAYLLGVAIPFGNLGKIPPHMFRALTVDRDRGVAVHDLAGEQPGNSSAADAAPWFLQYAAALAANAAQVHKYLNQYAVVGGLPAADLAAVNQLFAELQQLQERQTITASHVSSAGAAAAAVKITEDLVTAQLTYLSAAADVARKRFTLFQQGPIWLGCVLAVAVLVLQIYCCIRAIQLHNKAQARRLDLTGTLVYIGLAAFHALGLFSVGLIMGEGRLQCLLLAAATLLLLRSALRAVLGARSLAVRAAAAATQDTRHSQGDPGPTDSVSVSHTKTETVAATISVSTTPRLTQCKNETEGVTNKAALMLTTYDWSQPQVVVLVIGATVVMLACNAALQALGLIDRSGQDPHDKTQPSAELLVGADARLQQVVLLCFTVGPLICSWVGITCFSRWLQQLRCRGDVQEPTSSYDGLLLVFIRCCCFVACMGLAAFWVAQLTGHSDLTIGSVVELLNLPGQQQGLLIPRVVQGWLYRQWSHCTQVRQLLPVSPLLTNTLTGLCSFVAQLPFRLLVPRIVYISVLAAFVGVILRIGVRALALYSGLLARPKCMQVQSEGRSQRSSLFYGCEVLVWLSASLAAALVMVLGYKGPAMMVLAIIQGICCCLLLRVHAAANQYIQKEATLLKDAGQGPIFESTSGDVSSVVGSGVWAMMSLQLFFCSGHFCEFSGLQYTSAFIGFDDMIWYWSGSLLLLNTCGFLFLGCLTLPLLPLTGCLTAQSHQHDPLEWSSAQAIRSQLTCGVLVSNSARLAALAVSMISAAVQQQHILLWAIFAPKLVFELWFMAVTDVGQLLAIVLVEHIVLQK